MAKQHIVVVGGGFSGVKTALELSKHHDKFDITLISERPDFWYFPTLYHTATGGHRAQSSIPLKHLLHNKGVRLVIGKATRLDRTAKNVSLENGEAVPYDRLVLGLGVVTNYFGIPGLAEFTYGVKSIDEAETLKKHIHQQIMDERRPDLHYVVVGGGPTGIELAGNLGAYVRHTLKRHGVRGRAVHVDLVENGKHLMPRSPRRVGRAIEHRLRKLGVRLYLGKAVQGATADELTVSGKPIRSHTVIWTAGQANNPFFNDNAFALSPRKKVVVDEFLRAEHDIFVIGDNAETSYSGMAQTAIYDAGFVAANLVRDVVNEPKLAYRPKKPIYVTPAGTGWAAVEWGKLRFNGRLGWFLREAADFVAFTDIESPPEAVEQWAHSLQHQDLCHICSQAA